jgi:hypothetical protein
MAKDSAQGYNLGQGGLKWLILDWDGWRQTTFGHGLSSVYLVRG